MPSEDVERLLDEYVDAFNALDAARIADLYDEPCVIVDATATWVFSTHAELRANLDDLIAFYRSMNYREARRDRTVVSTISEGLVLADVAWSIETESGSVRFTTRYTIATRNGALRIATVVAGDEGTAWLG